MEALSDVLRFEVAGFGIDVAIVEPGLIRTDFGETAVGTIADGAAEEGPTRYPVTASARVMVAQRALLPDRLWDRVVGTSFPRPRA